MNPLFDFFPTRATRKNVTKEAESAPSTQPQNRFSRKNVNTPTQSNAQQSETVTRRYGANRSQRVKEDNQQIEPNSSQQETKLPRQQEIELKKELINRAYNQKKDLEKDKNKSIRQEKAETGQQLTPASRHWPIKAVKKEQSQEGQTNSRTPSIVDEFFTTPPSRQLRYGQRQRNLKNKGNNQSAREVIDLQQSSGKNQITQPVSTQIQQQEQRQPVSRRSGELAQPRYQMGQQQTQPNEATRQSLGAKEGISQTRSGRNYPNRSQIPQVQQETPSEHTSYTPSLNSKVRISSTPGGDSTPANSTKSKDNSKPSQKDEGRKPVKSNAILFLLAKLKDKKLREGFIDTKQKARFKRHSDAYVKFMIAKIRTIFNHSKYEAVNTILCSLLSGDEPTEQFDPKSPPSLLHKQLDKKVFVYFSSSLHALYTHKTRMYFQTLKNNKDMGMRTGLLAVNGLVARKMKLLLQKNLRQALHMQSLKYRLSFNRIVNVFASHRKQILQIVFIKLYHQTIRVIEQQKPRQRAHGEETPIHRLKQQALNNAADELAQKEPSPQVIKQYKSMETSMQRRKQDFENELNKVQLQLETVRDNHMEYELEVEEKKRICELLQKKIESIQIPQENYISDTEQNNISLTKFPLLIDAYLRILKMKNKRFEVTELEKMFPFLEEEFGSNGSVNQWVILIKNIELRHEIAKYEGLPVAQRKAATHLLEEQNLAKGIVQSYIKERYIWEWVKNIAANA